MEDEVLLAQDFRVLDRNLLQELPWFYLVGENIPKGLFEGMRVFEDE